MIMIRARRLRRRRDIARVVLGWCFAFLLAACGGGGGTSDGGGISDGGADGGVDAGADAFTACQQVGQAFCDQACACADGDKCAINDEGVIFSFMTDAECREFLTNLTCSGSAAPYSDPAACVALVQGAPCTGMGPMRAFASPTDPACDPAP